MESRTNACTLRQVAALNKLAAERHRPRVAEFIRGADPGCSKAETLEGASHIEKQLQRKGLKLLYITPEMLMRNGKVRCRQGANGCEPLGHMLVGGRVELISSGHHLVYAPAGEGYDHTLAPRAEAHTARD